MAASLPREAVSDEASLFIRLYLDEDVQKRVAPALRLRGFDATNVHELQRKGLSDEEQLELATTEGRTIFTYNTSDFLKLHLDWVRLTKEHAGIIVSDQLPIGEVTRRLLNLINQVTADEMRNQIYWLQAFK
jgi:predicted nuclease of predicted toxin-antitoxin system